MGTLTFYTNVFVRCSLFNNSTLNSSEEACWCESVHHPLKEQGIEGVRENGVGPSARSDLDVLDLGCGMQSFPLRLLLFVSLLVRVKSWITELKWYAVAQLPDRGETECHLIR